MKFSKAYKYQFSEVKPPLIVYYCVVIGIVILLAVLSSIYKDNIQGTISGMDVGSTIFLFILSLCIFSGNFSFLNQNGISRKTMILSCFAMFATIAGIMLVVDSISTSILYAGKFFNNSYLTLFDSIFYHDIKQGNVNTFVMLPTLSEKIIRAIANLGFNYVLYMAAMFTGYFISIVFYRMPTFWRYAVFLVGPVVFVNSLPYIYGLNKSFFNSVFSWIYKYCFSTPTGTIITMTIWSIVFATLAFFLACKASLKPKVE
jgi:hypothetical protein